MGDDSTSEHGRVGRDSEDGRIRLQALFDHAIDAIMLADDQGRYLDVNPAVCELTGYSRDELLAMGPADLAAPEQQPAEVDDQFQQFVRAGVDAGTFAMRHKDGHIVETEYRAVSNIQPGVHLSVLRDVTVRNRALRALDVAQAQSRELAEHNERLAAQLSATLESITDGLYTLDRDWRFTYLNGEAERLLRQPREALVGRELWELFAPTLGTEFEATLRRAMTEQVTCMLEAYYYPPFSAWFQVVVYPLSPGLTVYIRDVTEQRRAKQELRSLVAINGAAHALTDAQQLCELAATALVDAMLLPERAAAKVSLGASSATCGEPDAGRHALTIPIRTSANPCGQIDLYDRDRDGLLPEEMALARTAAETLGLWFGHRQATVGLLQANAELNLANEQLAEAARIKDDLLSMASHELRTPLTPILGFLETLELRGDELPREDQQRMLSSMQAHARRMLRLVDDLLVVSRATADALVARPQHVTAAEVLLPLLDELDGAVSGVETSIGDQQLFVDPQHLQQMALNLLTNSGKYGRPPIRFAVEQQGSGHVVLEVSDRGPGVAEEFQARMWERFSQKDRGDDRTATGTGLGLAIVKLLAEANGGTVGYRSASPTGAVFTVTLPPPPPRA